MNDFEFAFEVAKIADEVGRMKRNVLKAFNEINQEMPLPKSDDFVLDETDIDAVANDAFSNGYAKGLATALKIFCKAFETEPQTETKTETQNSNLTFEKRTMRDCYNCKRYEAEGECIECHYEPKDEPQTDVYEYRNGEWVKPDCPWK